MDMLSFNKKGKMQVITRTMCYMTSFLLTYLNINNFLRATKQINYITNQTNIFNH